MDPWSSVNGVLIRRGKPGHRDRHTERGMPQEDRHREKAEYKDGGRDWVMLPQAKEQLGQLESGRDKEGSPLEASEGAKP